MKMTQKEKEKIDYEIKAKTDARNKDLGEWGCAGLIAFFLFFMIMVVIAALI